MHTTKVLFYHLLGSYEARCLGCGWHSAEQPSEQEAQVKGQQHQAEAAREDHLRRPYQKPKTPAKPQRYGLSVEEFEIVAGTPALLAGFAKNYVDTTEASARMARAIATERAARR